MIEMSNPGMVPSTVAQVNLVADGKTLSTAPHRLGYLEPTDPGIGVEAIRDLYREHGYVWLKGFLPRTDVLEFRGWVFSHLADTGLIEPNSDPALGIAAAGELDKKLADRRLMSLVRSTAYEGFCAQPRLARFMDEFLGGLSYLHKRKIMRFTLPGTPTACAAARAGL